MHVMEQQGHVRKWCEDETYVRIDGELVKVVPPDDTEEEAHE